jgi:hypothetical protein
MGIFRSDIWDTSMLDTGTGYRYALILREAMNYGIEQAGRIATGLRWMCLAEDRARCLVTEMKRHAPDLTQMACSQ